MLMTVSIQAGGQSSRMGQDKALKPFLGQPLIQRIITRMVPIADEIIITTNRPEVYAFLGRPLYADLKPGRGALGGLYTALARAKNPLVAVLACDMPFASPQLVTYQQKVLLTEDVDVVIPASADGLEPLHAVYRRATCLPAIEAAITANQWKLIAWFPQVKVRTLTPAETSLYARSEMTFFNVNTPAEFFTAEHYARHLEQDTSTVQSKPDRERD